MRITVRLYKASNDTTYDEFKVTTTAEIIDWLETGLEDVKYCHFEVLGLCGDNACRHLHTLMNFKLDTLRAACAD